MLDAQAQTGLQRSCGGAEVMLGGRDGRPRLTRLHQSGAAKVFLPRHADAEAIFLNTAGGLTDGDQLRFGLHLTAPLRFTATTQTAERAYASRGLPARLDIEMRACAGAALDWLPQETILFEDARLRRDTDIHLDGDAALLLCETVMIGRHAMGEAPRRARLQDRRRVWRDGRLAWMESLEIGDLALAQARHPALLGAARCFATIAFLAPGAPDHAPGLRSALWADGCDTALSAWNGRLILRLAAREIWPLRLHLARLLTLLRGRAMPRVWQMNGDLT